MTFLFALSLLFMAAGFGILKWLIVPLFADLRQTVQVGAESATRLRSEIDSIRQEGSRLGTDLRLLGESAASWPRAAALPREAVTFSRKARALTSATAFLSTLRRLPW